MPIVQTAKRLKTMKAGEVLEVVATDPGIREDMPAWCRTTGQEFLGAEDDGEAVRVYIRKVAD
jgi:tRNA 2-thiouridine synthesizing protein A